MIARHELLHAPVYRDDVGRPFEALLPAAGAAAALWLMLAMLLFVV